MILHILGLVALGLVLIGSMVGTGLLLVGPDRSGSRVTLSFLDR